MAVAEGPHWAEEISLKILLSISYGYGFDLECPEQARGRARAAMVMPRLRGGRAVGLKARSCMSG